MAASPEKGKDSLHMSYADDNRTESEASPAKAPQVEGLKKIFEVPQLTALYNSPKGRYAFVEFFSQYFVRLGIKDKIDNNELNIIADFHYYNAKFAKEQLLLNDEKTTLLLNILGMLIAFRDFETTALALKSHRKDDPIMVSLPKGSEEDEFKIALEQRYDQLRDALMTYTIDNPPFGTKVFSTDEVKKILEYCLEVYFPHFRLYSYVLSNKQLSELKTIEVYIDEPLPIPPLSQGLIANLEREEIGHKNKEENSPTVMDPKIGAQKSENLVEPVKIEIKKDVPQNQPTEKMSKSEVKKLDRALPKLKKETENIIDSKIVQIKNELSSKIAAHEEDLEKTIEELRAKK